MIKEFVDNYNDNKKQLLKHLKKIIKELEKDNNLNNIFFENLEMNHCAGSTKNQSNI